MPCKIHPHGRKGSQLLSHEICTVDRCLGSRQQILVTWQETRKKTNICFTYFAVWSLAVTTFCKSRMIILNQIASKSCPQYGKHDDQRLFLLHFVFSYVSNQIPHFLSKGYGSRTCGVRQTVVLWGLSSDSWDWGSHQKRTSWRITWRRQMIGWELGVTGSFQGMQKRWQ